jgi:hypothetical protein
MVSRRSPAVLCCCAAVLLVLLVSSVSSALLLLALSWVVRLVGECAKDEKLARKKGAFEKSSRRKSGSLDR